MIPLTPQSLLLSLLLLSLLYILYSFFLSSLVTYLKFGFQIGFDKVALIYKPFTSLLQASNDSSLRHGTSSGLYLQKLKQNPLLKIIVSKILIGTQIFITDSDLIRKLNYDHLKNLEKANILIFSNEIRLGLLFEEREEWKKSRGIISNVFHFEMLRGREYLMEKVVEEKTRGLEEGVEDLFRFGRSIGGEIVVKSLFGEEFFDIRINGKNPYEEIHEILYTILDESFSLTNLLRYSFQHSVATKDSWFLTATQKKLLARIISFKNTAREFLEREKRRYDNKEEIPPFIEAYFKLNDSESYFQEIIHQLFFFLFAAEDTTGGAIEMSLALLATYPEYQSRILSDVKQTSIHTSKELNNFINEMSRLHSIVQLSFPRKILQNFTAEGVHFEKGQEITLTIGAPMVNPRYWESPEEFRPERFNSPLDNPAALIPFSSGPRNCIGQHMALMEIRIAVVRILERYRLVKIGGELRTNSGLNIINHLVESNFVRFERREEGVSD